MNRSRMALVGLGIVLGAWLAAAPAARASDVGPRRPAWDRETLDLFASLPVQDGGRVKPLDTLAGFRLLKLNGRRSCTTPAGERLGPIAWLLDCVFFPEVAVHYPCFLVQNDAVVDALGLSHEAKRKRDRYSYAELAPGFEKLRELAIRYSQVDEKDRSPVESQLVQLAHNAFELDHLIHLMDFARTPLPFEGSETLARRFSDPASRGLTTLLANLTPVLELARQRGGRAGEAAAVQTLLREARDVSQRSSALALIPPSFDRKVRPDWLTIGDVLERRLDPAEVLDDQVRLVGLLEQLDRARVDPAAFKAKLVELRARIVRLADRRGEYAKVPLEVTYYRWDFFYDALILYGLSFVLVALSWLWPHKLLDRGSLASLGLATALVVAGVALRCVIRGRPPVTTLYETIVFTTGVAVLCCAFIEWVNRQRIASAIATTIGFAGMFLAGKYEFRESMTAGDTMPSMIAVLDTNFWLATHVTTVTMGYSAGLLAAALGHVWLVGQVLGLKRGDSVFYKNVARMTYGVLCFGLLFSMAGTILGGIWANYSWGRFWGWDPKENGALLICLWELLILHARVGGHVRDFGLAVLSVIGGSVVAFSWWGVNLLGVGLHSYGFTSGVLAVLVTLWVVEGSLVAVALAWRLARRSGTTAPPTS